MKIEISRSGTDGKWCGKIDDVMITENQSSLVKLFHKLYKYAKSQDI